MPTYPTIRTFKSGFYNNKITNGINDRVYTADEMTEYYTGLFKNGVKPNPNGVLGSDLRVEWVNGLNIRVLAGDGLFGGRFFKNTSAYQITLDPISNVTRYDCVIVKSDKTDAVRDTTIYIRTLDHVPTSSDLTRNVNVNEYCLAYITITANADGIDQSNITDRREIDSLCGLITGAFNEFDSGELYNQFTAAFNNWFNDIKDQFVAGATLVHNYYNEVVSTTANQRVIQIGIPQYIKNTDVLLVMVEGRSFTENVNYVVDNNDQITLTIGLPVVGTKIEFQVLKSVDGSNAQTVVSQVNTLINQMNVVNRVIECDYYCNGTNDNILISQKVASFIANNNIAGDSQLLIRVHGSCGVTGKYYGDNYFLLGSTSPSSEKRVIIDFADCQKLYIPMNGNSNNGIFFGVNYVVKNLNLAASSFAAGCNVRVINSLVGNITFENCRIDVRTTGYCVYTQEGTHINCEVYLSSANSYSICFYPTTDSKPITVLGGNYKSYAASSSQESCIFYIPTGYTNAVIVAHGVSCPTVAVTNFFQRNCVKTQSGYITASGLITALTNVTTGSTASITGTIAISKP